MPQVAPESAALTPCLGIFKYKFYWTRNTVFINAPFFIELGFFLVFNAYGAIQNDIFRVGSTRKGVSATEKKKKNCKFLHYSNSHGATKRPCLAKLLGRRLTSATLRPLPRCPGYPVLNHQCYCKIFELRSPRHIMPPNSTYNGLITNHSLGR